MGQTVQPAAWRHHDGVRHTIGDGPRSWHGGTQGFPALPAVHQSPVGRRGHPECLWPPARVPAGELHSLPASSPRKNISVYHARQNVPLAFLLQVLNVRFSKGRATFALHSWCAFREANAFPLELVLLSYIPPFVCVAGLTPPQLAVAFFCIWDAISDFLWLAGRWECGGVSVCTEEQWQYQIKAVSHQAAAAERTQMDTDELMKGCFSVCTLSLGLPTPFLPPSLPHGSTEVYIEV